MKKEWGDSIVSQKAFIPLQIWSNLLMRQFLENTWVQSTLGIQLRVVKITIFDRLRWWFEKNIFWRFAKHRPDEGDY